MIESSIKDRLTGYTALTALVGTRIYPTTPRENNPALPYLTFTTTGTEPNLTTSGDTGFTKYTVEVEAFGERLQDVQAVQAACKAALHTYQGGNIHRAFLTTALSATSCN